MTLATNGAELSLPEAGEFIRMLEDELDLLGIVHNSVSVWPIYRMQFFKILLKDSEAAATKKSSGRNRFELMRFMSEMFRFTLPRKADVVCFTNSSWHCTKRDGKWFDVMFDDYLSQISSVSKFEMLNSEEYKQSRSKWISEDATDYAIKRLDGSLFARFPVKNEYLGIGNSLLERLAPYFRSIPFTAQQLGRSLQAFDIKRKRWASYLRRVGARFVLLNDGYFSHDLICGGRDAGCSVIELQHGAFTPDGIEYGWGNSAFRNRKTMPLPDVLALFGDYDKAILSSNRIWDGRLAVVGSARFDRSRAEFASLKNEYRAQQPLRLLVTFQGLSEREICLELKRTLEALEPSVIQQIIVRPHPCYGDAAAIAREVLGNEQRIRIADAFDGSETTLELIAKCDVHLSVSSTCLWESLGFGKHSVVMKMPLWETVQPMVESKVLNAVSNGNELAKYLLDVFSGNVKEPDANKLFRHGATQRFRELAENVGIRLLLNSGLDG